MIANFNNIWKNIILKLRNFNKDIEDIKLPNYDIQQMI